MTASTVPEQRNGYSLLGPDDHENLQNIDPQQSLAAENHFWAPGDAPQINRLPSEGGHTCGGRYPGGTPNGEPLEGSHFQYGEKTWSWSFWGGTPRGECLEGGTYQGGIFSHEKTCQQLESIENSYGVLARKRKSSVNSDDMLLSLKNRIWSEHETSGKKQLKSLTCAVYHKKLRLLSVYYGNNATAMHYVPRPAFSFGWREERNNLG